MNHRHEEATAANLTRFKFRLFLSDTIARLLRGLPPRRYIRDPRWLYTSTALLQNSSRLLSTLQDLCLLNATD